jgi:hypothetical protein
MILVVEPRIMVQPGVLLAGPGTASHRPSIDWVGESLAGGVRLFALPHQRKRAYQVINHPLGARVKRSRDLIIAGDILDSRHTGHCSWTCFCL